MHRFIGASLFGVPVKYILYAFLARARSGNKSFLIAIQNTPSSKQHFYKFEKFLLVKLAYTAYCIKFVKVTFC